MTNLKFTISIMISLIGFGVTFMSLNRKIAAEYLAFSTATGQGGVNAIYVDENVWLSQKMMGSCMMWNHILLYIIYKKHLKMMNWMKK